MEKEEEKWKVRNRKKIERGWGERKRKGGGGGTHSERDGE